MKDMGIVQGSAEQAVPLVIGRDTVYVHTDIQALPPDEEGRGDGTYQYHEVQFDKDEYIHLMAERASGMEEKVQAQATISAFSVGAEVQITPEIVELATQGATITEAENASEWRPGVRVKVGTTVIHVGKTYECLQEHVTLANWKPGETPALWVVKQADPKPGETLPWVVGEAVKTGDKRTFGGVIYECVQGHTTQAGWEPPNLPALWKKT